MICIAYAFGAAQEHEGNKMEKHPIDYLILVNPFDKIPEDFVATLELVEMKGYDDEVFRAEEAGARKL